MSPFTPSIKTGRFGSLPSNTDKGRQGSPKCGIVGGDKIEVRGGSSKRVREHAPPGNFENLQHL